MTQPIKQSTLDQLQAIAERNNRSLEELLRLFIKRADVFIATVANESKPSTLGDLIESAIETDIRFKPADTASKAGKILDEEFAQDLQHHIDSQ